MVREEKVMGIKYCHNCKYSFYEESGISCFPPILLLDAIDICINAKRKPNHRDFPLSNNWHGDCNYYKRKWWKLWV